MGVKSKGSDPTKELSLLYAVIECIQIHYKWILLVRSDPFIFFSNEVNKGRTINTS